MAFFLYALRGLVVDVYSFLLVALIGCFIYLLAAYFNKAFLKDERRIVNELLPRPLFVF